jgi:putative NADH-flavin reductase
MKLVIFGATGGIGRQVLEQAIIAGHDVTAVVRDPKKLSSLKALSILTADLATVHPDALATAIKGADAVISGLGPRSATDTGIASSGTRAIVQAMGTAHVRRIITVSAAPVSTVASAGRPKPPKHDPGDEFLMRYLLSPIIKAVFRKPYADLAIMEDVLRESGLDWTVVRPPRLSDTALTGKYRTAIGQNLAGGMIISRADVAHLMLATLERPETIKRTVGISY